MKIHSVLRGWTNFNSPHAEEVARDVASVETALKACQGYGADALLLVPCRLLANVALPKPEQFDIELDEKTGHLTRVVAGDNGPYADYLRAHNEAIDMARRALDQLIPVAEKTGVVIALENVWSNLWVLPRPFAHFVQSFQCPWIQSYFHGDRAARFGHGDRAARPGEGDRAAATTAGGRDGASAGILDKDAIGHAGEAGRPAAGVTAGPPSRAGW